MIFDKIHNCQNLIFRKIHIFKTSLFTKFTFSNPHISQKFSFSKSQLSHFLNLIIHRTNIFICCIHRTTYDGCAIAHATAKELCQRKCRTLFSTHYFELMNEFTKRQDMQVYHMSVLVMFNFC